MPWQVDRSPSTLGYLPGLDGIRALAVIGVLLYHGDVSWFRGGFLGVDVFFVLSGFLITSLILEEFDRSGRVNFAKFYLGRARRLLPALLLMLIIVGIAAAIFYRDAAYQFGTDALASIFYVNNWWYILGDQSYFAFTGRPPLLKHLWSLSVEEQFYLIWPAIAYLTVRTFGRRGVGVLAVVIAIASTAWMLILAFSNGFPEFADPSRAYFGTDSHIMGLLIGACLATWWRPRHTMVRPRWTGRLAVDGAGLASLLVIIAIFIFAGEFSPWLYRGGFLAIAIITAGLILAATVPGTGFGKALGSQPWRYIGQRSYGLYLWHWPVFMVTRPMLDLPIDGAPLLALRLALTFAITEASFRLIELPIRRGAIDRWVKRWRASTGEQRRDLTHQGVRIARWSAIGVLVLAFALATAADDSVPEDVAVAIGIANGGPTSVSLDDEQPSGPDAAQPTPSLGGGITLPTAPAFDPGPASAIGDSVMLGARGAVKEAIAGIRVDAAVARMPGAFVSRVRKLIRAKKLAPIIVVHPATNGYLPAATLRTILDMLRDRDRVVIVNADVPRVWQDQNNSVIAKIVPEYPNAVVADWYAASRDHPDYFVSDGFHLTVKGARAYAEVIRNATGLARAKIPAPITGRSSAPSALPTDGAAAHNLG